MAAAYLQTFLSKAKINLTSINYKRYARSYKGYWLSAFLLRLKFGMMSLSRPLPFLRPFLNTRRFFWTKWKNSWWRLLSISWRLKKSNTLKSTLHSALTQRSKFGAIRIGSSTWDEFVSFRVDFARTTNSCSWPKETLIDKHFVMMFSMLIT